MSAGQSAITAHAARGQKNHKKQYVNRGATGVFALAVVGAILFGWMHRDEYYLTAEHGLGYALGIVGGSMMLLLLLYPLRKRLAFMGHWLPLRLWFRTHMLLGVIGPLCILYHCNFHLGATNSNVALICMGLMVSSGLVGRYIYGKIHYGLYGQRATLQQLQGQLQASEALLSDSEHSGLSKLAIERLRALEIYALQKRDVIGNVARLAVIGTRIRAERKFVRDRVRAVAHPSPTYHEQVIAQVDTFLAVIRRAAGFSFYERLFSLWHVLHMPIFFMLVITGLIHVYAVHLY